MFTAPLWLLGLFSLLIPLLLHLWSRRPRQVIRVGTLRHVDLTADARSWSARLTDPLLLALRLALLTTIVFALAGLRLPTRRATGADWDLVLVEPALLVSSTPGSFPFLDSLKREHEPVRLLTRGLPKVQLGGQPQAASRDSQVVDIWSALIEADAMVGPKGTIHVVARPRLMALSGDRPHIRAKVVWHQPAPAGSAEWIATAWPAGDSTMSLSATGDQAGVVYGLTRAAGVCTDCGPSPVRRIAILSDGDTLARARITVALQAIATELGQPIAVTGAPDSANTVIAMEVSDSLLDLGLPLISLSPETVASGSVADSIWAHWPWPLIARDNHDPRLASLNQALASHPVSVPPVLGNPEATRRGLLLLALLLFGIERWLATRPGRREV